MHLVIFFRIIDVYVRYDTLINKHIVLHCTENLLYTEHYLSTGFPDDSGLELAKPVSLLTWVSTTTDRFQAPSILPGGLLKFRSIQRVPA
jgi:hypothetical protein